MTYGGSAEAERLRALLEPRDDITDYLAEQRRVFLAMDPAELILEALLVLGEGLDE